MAKIFIFWVLWLKKWHPDKWTRNPGVAGEAKLRFQQIQEAYSGDFNFPLKNILALKFAVT